MAKTSTMASKLDYLLERTGLGNRLAAELDEQERAERERAALFEQRRQLAARLQAELPRLDKQLANATAELAAKQDALNKAWNDYAAAEAARRTLVSGTDVQDAQARRRICELAPPSQVNAWEAARARIDAELNRLRSPDTVELQSYLIGNRPGTASNRDGIARRMDACLELWRASEEWLSLPAAEDVEAAFAAGWAALPEIGPPHLPAGAVAARESSDGHYVAA